MHLGLTGARNSEAPESHHNYVLHMRTLKPYNAQTARLDNSLRLLLRHVFVWGAILHPRSGNRACPEKRRPVNYPPPSFKNQDRKHTCTLKGPAA